MAKTKKHLIPLTLEGYKQTYDINPYEEKTILALLIKKKGMSPTELNELYKGDKSDYVGFDRACKNLSKLHFRFEEGGELKSILIKEKYRGGAIKKGFKYALDGRVFIDLFFMRFRLHYTFTSDKLKKKLFDMASSHFTSERYDKKYLRQAIENDLRYYNLEEVFHDTYNSILNRPTIKKNLSIEQQIKEKEEELKDLKELKGMIEEEINKIKS